MAVLSDRHRVWKVLACLALLVGLGLWYGQAAIHRDGGWRSCVRDPAAYDGAPVVFATYTVTAIHAGDHYEISGVVNDIPVAGETASLSIGDRVSVRGHFRASDQAVVEEDRLVHHLWVWKQRLGLLGLVLAVLVAPLCFTIRDGRVVERG